MWGRTIGSRSGWHLRRKMRTQRLLSEVPEPRSLACHLTMAEATLAPGGWREVGRFGASRYERATRS